MSAPLPASGFRLVRYFTVSSLVAFVLVAAALLYLARLQDDFHEQVQREQNALFAQLLDSFAKRHDAAAHADLLRLHEASNVNLARLLANTLWETDFAPFVAKAQRIPVAHCRAIADVKDTGGKTVQPAEKSACYAGIGKQITALPEFRALDVKVFDTMKKSTVFKIKVYDLRGVTVYSSEHSQIGEDKFGNVGWSSAVAGKPASQLSYRDTFSAFEGVVQNRDLMESYVPVLASGSEKVVGVFEVYSDVTLYLAQIRNTSSQIRKLNAENRAQLERAAAANRARVDAKTKALFTIILGLLALLYCALFLIVRRGQHIIDKHDFERRRAEERLRMQGAALDAAANTIVITDRNGAIQWVNRAFSTLTGYSAEEVIGQNPRMLKSGQHGPEFYGRMFDTLLDGSVWQGEIVNRYKNGRLATEEMTITPMRGDDGEITNFIAINQDITARKEAEMHRGRLSAILEASPDFVATADPDGRVLYYNNAARRLLELPEGVDPSQVRIGDTHPPWAAELVLNTGIPAAMRDGIWTGETALLTPGGREVPVIQVILAHKGADGKVEFLSTIAHDISERKRQEEKIVRLSRIRAVLSGINSTIVRVRDRQELFDDACRIAVEHGNFGIAWIGMLDRKTLEIVPVACAGIEAESFIATSPNTTSPNTPLGQGIVGRALREKRVVYSNDITEERTQGGARRQEAIRRGYRSLISFPLLVENEVVGSFSLFAKEPNFFDEEEIKLLTELAGDISFALQSIARQEKLEYVSYYDALTGLPNRQLFLDRLGQQMRSRSDEPRMVALILLDIERLRNVNETLGRHGGDELLRLVARRLERAFNGPDYIARIGADSFGVVIRGVRDAMEIAHAVEGQVLACFREPFLVNDTELRVAVKAGIAMFPADGGGADILFKNAEAALRKAKESGERFLFYAAEMNARAAHSLSLETRLRKAVEAQQFVLHYQPKVELAGGRVCGLEALIRWNDPETGLVPPMQFIPLLEETGMILEVGAWAIRKALEDHREWWARGLQPPRVAVNVSSIQLRQKNFVDVVRDAIGESPAGSHGLDLEITESQIMEDIEGNIEKLRAVRDMGVNIAIDDFGTGYSSLGYLAKLPVNALKIDRSFIITMVSNADSMTIVSAIISLAHSLNLEVIAEGVDSEEQRNLLKLLKCDEMQGYLFSRPVPEDQVEALLAKQ